MRFRGLLISILMAMSAPCMSGSGDIEVVVSNGAAHLHYWGDEMDLTPFGNSPAVDEAKILFVKSKDHLSYVVIEINGSSTVHGGSGHCGAGREGSLVWIKLRPSRVMDVSSVLLDSCGYSIEQISDHATNSALEIRYNSYGEDKRFVLKYDNDAPERGFSISAKPLDHEK